MVDIFHRVGIKAPIADVYAAVATVDGIANWWTTSTTGESKAGGKVEVRFLTLESIEIGSMNLEVTELIPNKKVQWRFTKGPEEWLGTDVVFELSQVDDYSIVLFYHKNWREPLEFMGHCSMKWATFMLSLKQLVETGKGKPSPNDVKIDNWN